jgi:hypothetical protein
VNEYNGLIAEIRLIGKMDYNLGIFGQESKLSCYELQSGGYETWVKGKEMGKTRERQGKERGKKGERKAKENGKKGERTKK